MSVLNVANDQWWYFAPYHGRTFELNALLIAILYYNQFSLFILSLIFITALKFKSVEYRLIAWIGFMLFAGGSVASIGGHFSDSYFYNFQIWGIMTPTFVILKFIQLGIHKTAINNLFVFNVIKNHFAKFVTLTLFIVFIAAWNQYNNQLNAAKIASNRFYVPELGGYLRLEWKDYIVLARKNIHKRVTEEYWGLWSAINKSFSNWPVDSVIHAFGRTRNIAKSALNNSDFIISTKYSASRGDKWQAWNLNQNFWFYDELILKWEPMFVSPTTLVWKKVTPRVFKDAACKITADKSKFILQSNIEGFYRVHINYSTSGLGRYILLIKNNVWQNEGGYVSVNPHESSVLFPIYYSKQLGNVYDTKIIGNEKVIFHLESCNAQLINFNNDEVLHIPNNDNDFYLTDGNWIHGIAIHWAGFFVPNNDQFINQYKVGKLIKFKNGDVRKIISVTPSGQYLNVDVEGAILNPKDVGLPNTFIIIDKNDDFSLTDNYWIHGIAINWAGFFFPNTDQFINQYKVGNSVKFKNSEIRKIIKIETCCDKYLGGFHVITYR